MPDKSLCGSVPGSERVTATNCCAAAAKALQELQECTFVKAKVHHLVISQQWSVRIGELCVKGIQVHKSVPCTHKNIYMFETLN